MLKKEDTGKLLKRYSQNAPKDWKRTGFAVLPTSVVMDERLSRTALVLFWVLTARTFRGKDYCFPSLRTLEEEVHASRPTVIKAVRELEAYGYLQVQRDRQKRKINRYFLKAKI